MTPFNPVTCQQVQSWIEDDHAQPLSIQQHVDSCQDCQRFLMHNERLETALKALPSLKAPDDLAERIMCRIEQEALSPGACEIVNTSSPVLDTVIRRTGWFTPRVRAFAAAVALLLLAGTIWETAYFSSTSQNLPRELAMKPSSLRPTSPTTSASSNEPVSSWMDADATEGLSDVVGF